MKKYLLDGTALSFMLGLIVVICVITILSLIVAQYSSPIAKRRRQIRAHKAKKARALESSRNYYFK